MRHLLVPICLVAGLTLSACDGDSAVRISSTRTETDEGGPLKVIDALQCPQEIGRLVRKGSAQAGGKVCTYTGPRGAEVTLHLVALDGGSSAAALQKFETELAAAMPHTMARMQAENARADAEVARADAELAEADAMAAAADAEAAADTAAVAAGEEKVNVRMPGMSVDTEGDKASVRMPGISINADGDKADIRIGGFSIKADDSTSDVQISSSNESVSIQANDDGAQIRTVAPGSATRATWLLTDNTPSDAGWRLVGYEARGPSGGPIVVATVRTKERDDDRIFDDAKDLVALNVGE